MSHVATIDVQVTDLDALALACKDLGLELVRNQQTYRWYGESMGDFPLPQGFTTADLGKCAHAIRIPDSAQAYEIGVVPRRDGKPGFALLWDFWQGGYGLTAKIGEQAEKLKQGYALHATVRAAQRLGHTVLGQQRQPNGAVVLRLQQGGRAWK